MYQYKIGLPGVTGFSLNSIYYANRSHGWTRPALEWASVICGLLDSPDIQPIVAAVRAEYDASKHVVGLDLSFFNPNFFTKTGMISRTSLDLDNILKPLIDVCFGERFHGSGNYKCRNFNINDSQILKLTASKHFSDIPYIVLTISLLPLPKKAA